MRAQHLHYIVDPITRQSFELTSYDSQGDHTMSGILISSSSWYPIVDGVPRILNGKLRTDFLQRHHAFLKTWEELLPSNAKREWQEAIAAIKDFDKFEKHLAKTGASFAWEWKNIYKENDFEKNNF